MCWPCWPCWLGLCKLQGGDSWHTSSAQTRSPQISPSSLEAEGLSAKFTDGIPDSERIDSLDRGHEVQGLGVQESGIELPASTVL